MHVLCALDAEEGRGGQDNAGDYDYGEDEDENLDGQEYGFVMFDPVWGKPDYPPGHRTTKCQVGLDRRGVFTHEKHENNTSTRGVGGCKKQQAAAKTTSNSDARPQTQPLKSEGENNGLGE